MSPIEVTLGGETHAIKPLSIRANREWRKKAAPVLTAYSTLGGLSSDEADSFLTSMSRMLVDIPDQMTDLFFEYAVDLKREEIEDAATEGELAVASQALFAVAFPLLQSLMGATGRVMGSR